MKDIKYKLQGNGRDSWEVKEYDNKGVLIKAEMVYEDPNKLEVSNIDIDSLTDEQLLKLKQRLGL